MPARWTQLVAVLVVVVLIDLIDRSLAAAQREIWTSSGKRV